MKEFGIRLKSKAPEWAKEVAENLIFVGGAAFAQFIISNSSKHVYKVNTQ
jgi:hypothetical protein